MKRQHIFWRISVLLLIFTFGLGLNSCGTKSRSAGEPFSIQTDGIRLTAFDSAGNPSKELTQKLSLTEDMNESSGEYLIHASNVNGWSNLYIELEYSPTLHLSNIERGELFASGLMYYREVEAGKSILVLVNPGSQPQLESGSGIVGIIHLRNSGTEKIKPISAATDDPYIQETKEYEEAGQKYLEWTEVLRGDCNQNHKVDFADFGIIGARYNQTVNTADSVIDPNQNGKVEFSDFGEIGLRYSRLVSGFSVYAMNYGSYSQVKQFSFTDQDSKIAPAGKNDKGWLKYKIPVEWISDGSSRVEPVSITSGQYYLIKKIGPAGGKIETNNFRLEIPAGAFDTDYTLEVQIQTQNLAMFESMCSSPYSIKGLPDKILKPLSVEFKYRAPVNQPIKGNRYVQLQERKQPLDVHNQNWLYGYHTFEVTQSGE